VNHRGLKRRKKAAIQAMTNSSNEKNKREESPASQNVKGTGVF